MTKPYCCIIHNCPFDALLTPLEGTTPEHALLAHLNRHVHEDGLIPTLPHFMGGNVLVCFFWCASCGSLKKECENCPNCAQARNLAERPRWFKVRRTSPHDSVFCTMFSQRSSLAGECGEITPTNRVALPTEKVKKGVKKRKSSKKKSPELPKASQKSVM